MRKWVKILIPTVLLVGGVVLCAVRWQAWFGMPNEPEWTGDTLVYTFPTFAQESVRGFVRTDDGWQDTRSPKSLDILVLGDIHNSLRAADYLHLARQVPQVDAIAQVGDWLDRGQFYYYQLLLREYTSTPLATLPVINCPGNHEYSKGWNKSVAPDWLTWFPQEGTSFCVDFPQVRFIVLDTNPLDHLVYMTRALTWLRKMMYSAGDRYIVVLMHHPVLPAGKGRFYPAIYSTFRHALGEADLVISGHDHSYQRRMPFVVLNTAGKAKEQQETFSTDCRFTEPVYGVLTVNDNLQLRIYSLEDDSLIDSVYVKHD